MRNLLSSFVLSLLFGSVFFGSAFFHCETVKGEMLPLFVSNNVIRVVSGDFASSEWENYNWDAVAWSQLYQATFESSTDEHWTPYTQELISLTDHILGWYEAPQEGGGTDIAEFTFNELGEDSAYAVDAIRVTFTLIQHGEWDSTTDVFNVTDANGGANLNLPNELLNYSGLCNRESYSAQEFELIFPKAGDELLLSFQSFFDANVDGDKRWGINDFTVYRGQTIHRDNPILTPAPSSAVILGLGILALCGNFAKRKKYNTTMSTA